MTSVSAWIKVPSLPTNVYWICSMECCAVLSPGKAQAAFASTFPLNASRALRMSMSARFAIASPPTRSRKPLERISTSSCGPRSRRWVFWHGNAGGRCWCPRRAKAPWISSISCRASRLASSAPATSPRSSRRKWLRERPSRQRKSW